MSDMPIPSGTLPLLATLIALPTVSGTPNVALIDHVERLLGDHGARTRRVPGPGEGLWNLHAVIGPDNRRGLMLSGHSDVVPVAGQDWSSDPFMLTEREDRLHGRGTADMKGFLACAIAAFLRAAAAPAALTAPLHLAISCEEEVGCVGVRSLLPVLAALPAPPALCLVGEPTSLRLATGHKGKHALRVTCTGRPAHSALPAQGLNAISLAAQFVTALEAEQARLVAQGGHDPAFEVPHSTLHVGTINGGSALNIVPGQCVLDIELRSIPADDASAILARLDAAAQAIVAPWRERFPEAAIRLETVNAYPGLATRRGPAHDAAHMLMTALTGSNAPIKLAFGTEGGLLDIALDTPVLICGPGSMEQGHKADEFVTRDQLERCDAMLDALVERLCRASSVD